MKPFKEGDDVYIKGKILSMHEEDKFPITVEFSTNIDTTFKADGRYTNKDTIPCLFHLSEIQQSQFTDEELQEIKECVFFCHENHVDISKITVRGEIIDKINNIMQSSEEKQLLELASRLGYKVEKI
jgi:hypothetical protein